jgi:hypothetical protein
MRRILFSETDFNTLPNPPAGFKYIGFDGPNFTSKDETGTSVPTGGGGGLLDVSYSELTLLIGSQSLTPGTYYRITDFRTCYDQPNYDIYRNAIMTGNYKVGEVFPIIVFAISSNGIAQDAWQEDFPLDKIKYFVGYETTEITGGTAYGRITERIDQWNNRTDYDHREILFKRYDTFVYNPNQPQFGTISVANGIVSGIETQFTEFVAGDIIAIPAFEEIFFEISSIESNGTMSLTGSVWDVTQSNIKYYSIDYTMRSYYKNNVSSEDPNYIYEYTTFGDAIDNDGAFGNYIGDHSNGFINDGYGDFLLANNVFLDGVYSNNKFGNNCYNNTFDDDCTNNTIGNWFHNNITDDDFDGNQIGTDFRENIITANFQRNIVGENFNNNTIVNTDFYRNRIGEQFEENKISGANFQNNVIGNAFRYNTIRTNYDGFLKNTIGHGFNGNLIFSSNEFNSNKIGNGMNENTLYCYSYENKIGDYFANNTIGTQDIDIDFYENDINNDFYGNSIYREFNNNSIGYDASANSFYNYTSHNNIGNSFDNNTIGTFETQGGFNFRYNTIGYFAKGNLFKEDIESNEFGDNLWNNEFLGYTSKNKIGHWFSTNDVYNDFSNNIFGNSCDNNTLGTSSNYNVIGNNFSENNISYNFAYNVIGNSFYGNNIENDFGFGGSVSRGNKIGNSFNGNSIGEYFYDNTVADLFFGNTVSNYFQMNDVKSQNLNGVDFSTYNGNILEFTTNFLGLLPNEVVGTTYSNVSGTYSYAGSTASIVVDAVFDIFVFNQETVMATLVSPGKYYLPYVGFTASTITISGTKIGGLDVTDDVNIYINEVSSPSVYEEYNTEIFTKVGGVNRLSYYDSSDILTITDIDK